MTRLRHAGFVLVATLTTSLLLAGCIPEAEPVASAPPPSPSPSAEPAATRPNPVFALNCDEVLSLDEVQARVTAAVEIRRDETNVPGALFEIPSLQRGGLSCRWGGENRTDESYDDGVDVLVLPDAIADFEEREAGFAESWEVDGADRAAGTCYFASEPANGTAPGACMGAALIGSTLIDVRFSDSDGQYASEAAIGEIARELLETVVARVISAGPREQLWVAPPSGAQSGDFCGTLGQSFVTALALDDLSGGEIDSYIDDATSCAYSSGSGDGYSTAGITALYSAAWVAGVEQTESPGLADVWQEQRTSAGALWWLSPDGETISARAAIDGDLVTAYIASYELGWSPEQAATVLKSFMEEVAEAPPGT